MLMAELRHGDGSSRSRRKGTTKRPRSIIQGYIGQNLCIRFIDDYIYHQLNHRMPGIVLITSPSALLAPAAAARCVPYHLSWTTVHCEPQAMAGARETFTAVVCIPSRFGCLYDANIHFCITSHLVIWDLSTSSLPRAV